MKRVEDLFTASVNKFVVVSGIEAYIKIKMG